MTKEEVIDLIRDTGWGMLATCVDGQPFVRPMMPLLTDDNRIILGLLARSRTIEHINKNPKAEICFVDRKMWYARISGEAKMSDNMEDKELLWNCIPHLKQYFGSVDDENFKLMEMAITGVEAMSPHQKSPENIDF